MLAPVSRKRRGRHWCQLERRDPHTGEVPQVEAVITVAGVHLCPRHATILQTIVREITRRD